MNQYLKYVQDVSRTVKSAKKLPLGGSGKIAKGRGKGGKVLIFAPHPDDECIIGLLPMRLMKEADMRITDIAVTLGSNKARRKERLKELSAACRYLGWNIEVCGKDGFAGLRKSLAKTDPKLWNCMADEIAKKIISHRPNLIFAPNPDDANATHQGVSALVRAALKKLPKDIELKVVLTEFWGENKKPNLFVEASSQDLADIIKALTFHTKEVERNPYHLSLPFWMANNVRRGAEVVGGQGAQAPSYEFGVIYKIYSFRNGALKLLNLRPEERFIGIGASLKDVVKSWK